MLEHGLLEHIGEVSSYLKEKLQELWKQSGQIRDICCKGLAASIEFRDQDDFASVQKKAKEAGLIVGAGENHKLVLRPPYVITKEDIDAVISILGGILQS